MGLHPYVESGRRSGRRSGIGRILRNRLGKSASSGEENGGNSGELHIVVLVDVNRCQSKVRVVIVIQGDQVVVDVFDDEK